MPEPPNARGVLTLVQGAVPRRGRGRRAPLGVRGWHRGGARLMGVHGENERAVYVPHLKPTGNPAVDALDQAIREGRETTATIALKAKLEEQNISLQQFSVKTSSIVADLTITKTRHE